MDNLKEVTLTRTETGPQGTFGWLAGPLRNKKPEPYLRTGELPWNGNARGTSCIPAGRYRCHLRPSARKLFGGPNFFEIQGVPGRDGVLIHAGNWCGDKAKGYLTDTKGCVLVGMSKQERAGIQLRLCDSRMALQALRGFLGDSDFWLTVAWAEGLNPEGQHEGH